MMQDTACGKKCPFVKTGFCEDDTQCPHYMESWWIEGQTEKHILIKDCAPKRLVLQNQYMQFKIEELTKSNQIQQNSCMKLAQELKNLVDTANRSIELENQQRQDHIAESELNLIPLKTIKQDDSNRYIRED